MTKLSETAWFCTVCGYIHYGSEPPNECPVCGASKEEFELLQDEEGTSDEKPVSEWRCKECGYIHYGSEPPEFCPVCGQPDNQFEPLETKKHESSQASQPRKIVIVGAGIAGVSAAEAARKANSGDEIILISDEKHLPYYRLNLTRYLAGNVTREELTLHPQEWYTENSIQLLLNTRVESIDPLKKVVTLTNNQQLVFDTLILTVGSEPFVPPITGADKKGVFTLRTIDDADAILAACAGGKQCVCIGGGLLGLETAGGLAQKGVKVTVLENQDWLMPRQLNKTSAQILLEKIETIGIKIMTGVNVSEITGDGAVMGVSLKDGTFLPADVVVISAGIRSNLALAKAAGLSVKMGIVVDPSMRASAPHVFAAGDDAELEEMVYGTWGPAQGQGTVAGMNAVNKDVQFSKIARSNKLKVLGFDVFSIGQNALAETGKLFEYKTDSMYAGFLFENDLLCGAILIGDISLAPKIKSLIDEKVDFSEILRSHPDETQIYEVIRKKSI